MSPPVVDVIQCSRDLERLRKEWEAIWQAAVTSTPFQSPSWLLPWWKDVGRGELFTPVVRDPASGAVLGILPLYIHREGNGAGGRRKLFPLGMATTDFLDLLCLPGWEDACARRVLDFIGSTGEHWDECSLPQLPEHSPLLRHAAAALPHARIAPAEPCPRVLLPSSAQDFLRRLPGGLAQGLRTAEHRAERSGGLLFRAADVLTFDDDFDALVRLHARRQDQRGRTGLFSYEGTAAALRASAEEFLRYGLLRLYVLEIGGEPAAALLGFLDPRRCPPPSWGAGSPGPESPSGSEASSGRRFYYYIGGFDPRFAACSPGGLLIAHAAQVHIREGGTVFEFLRGREPYKYRWGAADVPTSILSVGKEPVDG